MPDKLQYRIKAAVSCAGSKVAVGQYSSLVRVELQLTEFPLMLATGAQVAHLVRAL